MQNMAKGFGKFLGLATIAALAVAGYSAYKQYKQESEDLNDEFKDFDDFNECEENDFEDEVPVKKPVPTTIVVYPELKVNKEEFVESAKIALDAAKGMIVTGVELAKSAGKVIADNSADLETKAKAVINDSKVEVSTLKAKGADKAADILEGAKEKVHEAQEILDIKIEELKVENDPDGVDIEDIDGDSVNITEEDK